MPIRDEWIELAPQPAELALGQKWHVFLSYRSVERSWVLSLYDTLTELGNQTFLDQFVLDASSGLTHALEENLQSSQAGILVWSPRNEDSVWCKHEYDAFVTREASGNFRFVIARLDNARLPIFAASKLYVDFSEDRTGPRGANLLKLLWGLQGKPIPPRAVYLGSEIEEQTKRALARIRAATEDNDEPALLGMSTSSELAWTSGPQMRCACAEALISIGAPNSALPLLEQVGADFPKSLRARQLYGLALARACRWREAKAVLGELYELGERDAETVGIYARTWMDSFDHTGNPLHLRRSRDLYADAFQATPSSYYAGINAAAKSVFLNELDAAAELATRVETLVGVTVAPNDYWKSATAAEAQLILRRFTDAGRLYDKAVSQSPGRTGDHEATFKQAMRLIEHLAPTPEEREMIRAPFKHLSQAAKSAEA